VFRNHPHLCGAHCSNQDLLVIPATPIQQYAADPSRRIPDPPRGSQQNPYSFDSDDELEESISTPTPSPPRRVKVERTPQIEVRRPGGNVKPGILSSAGRWLSKVPSIGGYFTPPSATANQTDIPEAIEEEEADDPAVTTSSRTRKPRRSRVKATPSPASPEASSSPGKRRSMVPVVEMPERKRRRVKSEPVAVEVSVEIRGEDIEEEGADDDEDELLLSPEEGRKRKREEEEEIAARQGELAKHLYPDDTKLKNSYSFCHSISISSSDPIPSTIPGTGSAHSPRRTNGYKLPISQSIRRCTHSRT
jgi:hypothetical protein